MLPTTNEIINSISVNPFSLLPLQFDEFNLFAGDGLRIGNLQQFLLENRNPEGRIGSVLVFIGTASLKYCHDIVGQRILTRYSRIVPA